MGCDLGECVLGSIIVIVMLIIGSFPGFGIIFLVIRDMINQKHHKPRKAWRLETQLFDISVSVTPPSLNDDNETDEKDE